MDELSKEELQNKILELTELNKKLSDKNMIIDTELTSLKEKEQDYLKTIKETRDLNNRLVLQVTSQTFTEPKGKETDDEPKEEIKPLEELIKLL